MLKVAGGKQHILSDHLVFVGWYKISHVLPPGYARCLAIFLHHLHCHLLAALLVHFINYVKIFFLKVSREVGAPSQVAAAEGEEDVEGPEILQLGNHFIFNLLPVSWSPLDIVKHSERVLHLVPYLTANLMPLPPVATEVGISAQSLSLNVRHCCKNEAWRLGKSFVYVEDPLLEIVLVSELDLSLEVAAKLSIR